MVKEGGGAVDADRQRREDSSAGVLRRGRALEQGKAGKKWGNECGGGRPRYRAGAVGDGCSGGGGSLAGECVFNSSVTGVEGRLGWTGDGSAEGEPGRRRLGGLVAQCGGARLKLEDNR
jgi:hypothetical protein